MPDSEPSAKVEIRRLVWGDKGVVAGETTEDVVAVESPLEVRVEGKSVAVIMRTPGEDRELAAGFLLTEGIIHEAADIFEISVCPGAVQGNVVDVLLRNPDRFDLSHLTRHVFTSSSCGLCGKASVEAAFANFPPLAISERPPAVPWELLRELPERQRAAQPTFAATGGLHASTIFDLAGNPVLLREDVGRHNALDKVLGASLLGNLLPLDRHILLLSGRVSFELMQKALAARIPIIAAIGAPSSLAVDFARSSGQTLVGFLRNGRGNLYSS